MKKGKKRTQNGNPLSEQFRIPYADVASKSRRSDGQGAGEVEFTRAAPPLEIAVDGRNGHLVGRDGDPGACSNARSAPWVNEFDTDLKKEVMPTHSFSECFDLA